MHLVLGLATVAAAASSWRDGTETSDPECKFPSETGGVLDCGACGALKKTIAGLWHGDGGTHPRELPWAWNYYQNASNGTWLSLDTLTSHIFGAFPETACEANPEPPRWIADLRESYDPVRDAIHHQPFLSGSGFDASLKQIWSDVCTFFPYGDSDAEKLAASVAASADPVVLCLSMRAQNKFHQDIALVRDFLDLFANRSLVVVKYDTDFTMLPTATRVTGGLKAQSSQAAGLLAQSQRAEPMEALLSRPNVRAWFATNEVARHPKLHPLPIGIPGPSAHISPVALRTALARTWDRPKRGLLLVNFAALSRGRTCERPLLATRAREIWPFATVLPLSALNYRSVNDAPNNRVPGFKLRHGHDEFFELAASFRFLVSPPGSGWDCYRTWEALWLGTIPIVLRTGTPFDSLFDDLPVLLVDAWTDVTRELLDTFWDATVGGTFNLEKLTARYWAKKIAAHAASRRLSRESTLETS